MVYLMMLFAEWSEWMGRRSVVALEKETVDKLGREIMRSLPFLHYTRNIQSITCESVKQRGVDFNVYELRGFSFRETFDFIYRREIINILTAIFISGDVR